MEEIGHRERALVPAAALGFAVAALAVAAVASLLAWPFAIDDAWIGVRYARHLAAGAGYVWNVGSAPTDGVTPLPWAFMLLPLAGAAPAAVLARAKLAGAVVWSCTATFWGAAVGRASSPRWAKVSAVLVLGVDLPVAAHAVSGMETAFAMALATLAALAFRRPRVAATLAGLAATLRPELVVWAVTLAAGLSWVGDGPRRALRTLSCVSIAALPFALVAAARGVAFGHVAPLAVLAKPSDLAHGLPYAVAAAIFTLAPILLLAPLALARERGPALAITLAACAHLAAVAAVGGDWMPYARLVAPIVPSMLYAFVRLAPFADARLHVARLVAALGVALWFGPGSLGALRRAGHERSAMIEAARSQIPAGASVATVDIGWVSAISEGVVVDLAGVTDPEVASLGGGHTSKRIDPAFLVAKAPDLAIFYADPLPATLLDVGAHAFPRVVEARLAASSLFTDHFTPVTLLPLGRSGAGYVIFRRR